MTSAPILRHYIGGERVAAPPRFDSLNPSNTNDIVARVPDGDAAAVDAAVGTCAREW